MEEVTMAAPKNKNIVKFALDCFDYDDFELLAIQSGLEDYRLAFNLNKILHLSLVREKQDIHLTTEKGDSYFSYYVYEDLKQDLIWRLIENKTSVLSKETKNGSLFNELSHPFETATYLIPELKNFDYLLQIENVDVFYNSDEIIKKISDLKYVSTVYASDTENIKSIHNLIF